jgi:hypothetical protein
VGDVNPPDAAPTGSPTRTLVLEVAGHLSTIDEMMGASAPDEAVWRLMQRHGLPDDCFAAVVAAARGGGDGMPSGGVGPAGARDPAPEAAKVDPGDDALVKAVVAAGELVPYKGLRELAMVAFAQKAPRKKRIQRAIELGVHRGDLEYNADRLDAWPAGWEGTVATAGTASGNFVATTADPTSAAMKHTTGGTPIPPPMTPEQEAAAAAEAATIAAARSIDDPIPTSTSADPGFDQTFVTQPDPVPPIGPNDPRAFKTRTEDPVPPPIHPDDTAPRPALSHPTVVFVGCLPVGVQVACDLAELVGPLARTVAADAHDKNGHPAPVSHYLEIPYRGGHAAVAGALDAVLFGAHTASGRLPFDTLYVDPAHPVAAECLDVICRYSNVLIIRGFGGGR